MKVCMLNCIFYLLPWHSDTAIQCPRHDKSNPTFHESWTNSEVVKHITKYQDQRSHLDQWIHQGCHETHNTAVVWAGLSYVKHSSKISKNTGRKETHWRGGMTRLEVMLLSAERNRSGENGGTSRGTVRAEGGKRGCGSRSYLRWNHLANDGAPWLIVTSLLSTTLLDSFFRTGVAK